MSGTGRSKSRRPNFLRLWLSAIDPGLIKLHGAGRAALALLSIWLVIRAGVRLLTVGGGPPIALFGVLSGIIFLLFIIDLKPSDRRLSLWLAPIPFAGAVILASALTGNFWLNNLILLFLFFFSYFFRRFGTRAGELALVTTVGFYIGFLLHLPQAIFPLFLASVFTSVVIVYLWQFVLLPYNPANSLQRSVIAFYHNVARTIAITRQGLVVSQADTQYSKRLQGYLRDVHINRRIIEGLFSATVSPTLWSQSRLDHLQEEMFKTERGLELLIEAAIQLNKYMSEMPTDVSHTLIEGLTVLEDHHLEMASGGDQLKLVEVGEALQLQLKSSLEGKPSAEWAFSLLRIGIAMHQLAHSIENIRTIEKDWNESALDTHPTERKSAIKKMGFVIHPTSILGIQAVLATGLAMLAAYLLNFDQPNLVYWTAFVVIAGSTGESLRRMTLRIIGVIAGTVFGVFLAILLPDNLTLVVLAVTICLFMTVYTITTSYVWMVFWLNIAIMLVITTLGGPALELLVVRPISTLLGAAIAALVVVFVLPIHVQKRFTTALLGFLTAVDRYIEIYVSSLLDPSEVRNLRAEELNLDSSYKELELTLPAVTYEYNPLSRSQSRYASQATSLAVVKSYVTHLDADVGAEPGVLADSMQSDLIRGVQSQLHANVIALNNYLALGQGEGMRSLSELRKHSMPEVTLEQILTAEAGSVEAVRNRAIYYIIRIHDSIFQIASGLGVAVV